MYFKNTSLAPLSSFASHNPYTILDSGATGTFVTTSDAKHLLDKSPIGDGPTVLSASGTAMPVTLQGQLPLSNMLSMKAQSAFVLDDLKTGTLILLAQLCDDDCIAVFNKYDVKILKNDQVIITGTRLPHGLWSLPILHAPSHQANQILRTDTTKRELATYLHAALGSPAPSTLLQAICRGHLATIPGLTSNLISKHLPKSLAATLGHQDQEAKHSRSTKISSPSPAPKLRDYDLTPVLGTPSQHTFAMLFAKTKLIKSYSGQTGQFPIPSSRGNHYIFVLYHHDTNSVHAVAIPNRQAAGIRTAWEVTHKCLIDQGHPPNLHILDNECSQELKDSSAKYHVSFQRVPPKEHGANAAERAMRTFKNHFISTLCTVDSNFSMSEWDRLLPQTILTLNLLRSSRTHASLFGNYDFNRLPIAPHGTKIVAHVSAEARTTFVKSVRTSVPLPNIIAVTNAILRTQ